ncbi:hypothetical protein HYT53_05485 [Candidatus Woesearchaeota archaeon]|nr:hypothetical protein [Candidatus Woesearchaeota archaeon]
MDKTKLFKGNPIKHRVQDKHRVSIPAKFRELLDNNIVYTNYINNYLIRCYPKALYECRISSMLKRSPDDHERQIFFLAESNQIDGEGRILLKGPMSDLEEVIFAANGDVFDIWNPKEFPYKDHITE